MRILHVMASRANGGAETYSTDMIASLQSAGAEQVAVIPRDSIHYQKMIAAGIPLADDVLDVPLSLWRRHRLRGVINAFNPDLVHCWMRRAASLVPTLQVPVIGWFGGYYDPAHFKCSTHFVGVTPGIVTHMVERGVPRDRAHYVQTFPTVDDAPAVDRALHDTPSDAPLLVTLSRLHEKKGLDILLRALTDLPGCFAWLAGDGPLEQDLRMLAASLGVAERVRFLGWRTDRGALLRAADICVLPSRWEPFGTVMLEAWAAGAPLVAAASQGPAALVEDGRNGLVVPVEDAQALAAAVRRLLADTPLRRRLIERGRADYLKDFTRDAATQRMLAVYRHILDAHEAGCARAGAHGKDGT